MTDKRDGSFTSTSPKILMYPHLHEAVKMQLAGGRESKDKSFSASFVINADDADLETVLKLLLGFAKDAHPAEYAKAGPAASFSAKLEALAPHIDFALSRGDIKADARKAKGKDDGEFLRGAWVLKASSGEPYPPALGGVENGRPVDYDTADKLAMSKTKFFFGAECFFRVKFAPYRVGTNKPGVKAYLSQVFATGKGTKMASGSSAAETFGSYMGSISNTDPTQAKGETLEDLL